MATEHEQGAHARLSPSAAERWISCPASIRMEREVPPETESAYAAEGTAAHALGELKARAALTSTPGDQTRREWKRAYSISDEIEDEMDGHTDAYLALIKERLDRVPGSALLLEQRLPTGIPGCWGTSDTVIVSPEHVEIIDLKYGQGVRVEARGNPQLRLYAVGALEALGGLLGTPERVYMTVFQPRLSHVDTEEMSAADLIAWRDSLLPIAEAAMGPDAPFGPSDVACRWCPASGRCQAQTQAVFSVADVTVKPDTLSPEDVGEALAQLPFIRAWATALEAHALDTAYSQGKPIPGFKVVLSGGRRVVTDKAAATDILVGQGYTQNEVAPPALLGIGDLEKLLGKDKFAGLLGDVVTKTEGRPSLVPEDDRRPAINPNTEALKEFEQS